LTGSADEMPRPTKANSIQSLQIMLYTHALAGSSDAARFLSPDHPDKAPNIARQIMALKLQTYLKFNATYPGFGGYLPWFMSDQANLSPTWDWVNRVPALDNGELLWAVYGAVQVLGSSDDGESRDLARGWQAWLDYAKGMAGKVFYAGNGGVCAVTDIKTQVLLPNDPGQSYSCEGSGRLDDPYEGELFTWWLYFFGGLSGADKNLLWEVKRPKLQSVEYNMGGVGPITVQKGTDEIHFLRWLSNPSVRFLVLKSRTVESDGDALLRRRPGKVSPFFDFPLLLFSNHT
jgi:hypothetical protein